MGLEMRRPLECPAICFGHVRKLSGRNILGLRFWPNQGVIDPARSVALLPVKFVLDVPPVSSREQLCDGVEISAEHL